MICFECGDEAVHNHHVVPQSLGGTHTVPLCGRCHSLLHRLPSHTFVDHSTLVVLGVRRPEARARLRAARPFVSDEIADLIRQWHAQGIGPTAIAETLNRRGVPTARGGREWRPSSVISVLRPRAIRLPDEPIIERSLPPVPRLFDS